MKKLLFINVLLFCALTIFAQRYTFNEPVNINGAGGTGIDLKVNGRLRTGDSKNRGGMWVNGGQTMFVGQLDANRLGFWNGSAWRLAVDKAGHTTITGGGNTSVDLMVNGRLRTGDSKNRGGMWVNGGQTMFVGQLDANRLGFWNGSAWRLAVDKAGHTTITGGGNTSVDLMVNGRLRSGDSKNRGGMWVNGGQTMFVGQLDANRLGFWNGSAWRLAVDQAGHTTITGGGNTSVDLMVNGRLRSGDSKNRGGMWVNGGQTMFVGQLDADRLGFWNGSAWRLAVDKAGHTTITGGGSTSVDLMVNGRLRTGDSKNRGGMWVNGGQTMFVGQLDADRLGFWNGSAWRLAVDKAGHTTITGGGSTSVDLMVNGRLRSGDSKNRGGMWVNGGQTMFVGQVNASQLGFWNNGAWRLVVDNQGNVGIGTASPKSKLAVNGEIRAKEINVMANIDVPDYVFKEDYDLPSISSTKEYINENKHLPGIPSASEIGESGINVGEMNLMLLKKIEELTLYIIDQNERIESLEEKLSE